MARAITSKGEISTSIALPLPDCAKCAGRFELLDRSLRNLMGDVAGVVVSLAEVGHKPDEPSIPTVIVSKVGCPIGIRSFSIGAAGKGWDLSSAIGSTIGESIERYEARWLQGEVTTTASEALDEFIDPSRLSGLTAKTARDAGLVVGEEILWARATRITDRRHKVWVPATSVFMNERHHLLNRRATPMTSNGIAFAGSLEEAIYRARMEVVERHVFFSVWYGNSAPLDTNVSHLAPQHARGLFKEHGLETRLVLLGVANELFVFGAACMPSRRARHRPNFTLGLGCASTADEAAQRAFLEMAQVYRGLTYALESSELSRRADALASGEIAVTEPYDHALYHARHEGNRSDVLFRPRTAFELTTSSLAEDELLFFDLTTSDVRGASGWSTARVIAPDALPYHYGPLIPGALISSPEPTPTPHPLC